LGAECGLGPADAELAGVNATACGPGDLALFLGDDRRLRLHRVHINSDARPARLVPYRPEIGLFGAEMGRLGDTAVPCGAGRW
jgi:hypothetical protein